MRNKKQLIFIFLVSLLVLTPFSSAFELSFLDLDGNTLVGRKDPDGRKYFYHPDHLGSTDLVTDENQQIVELTTYKPYGEEEENEKLFMLQHTLEGWGNEGL